MSKQRTSSRDVGIRYPLSAPVNWPEDVSYLAEACSPSPNLSPEHKRIFCSPLPADSPFHPALLRSQDWTVIKPITSPAHPAYGQSGLFAKKAIPPRTILLLYFGQVHTEEESDESSDYDLGVWAPSTGPSGGDGMRLGIDATKMGNEARFVNDYRGVAQRANVEFQEYEIPAAAVDSLSDRDDVPALPLRGLYFQSGSREIKPGEELLTSYGKGFWAARKPAEVEEDEKALTEGQAGTISRQSQAAPVSHVEAMLARQRARLQGMKSAR
ncbi:hypothetical protein BCV69DRAFT_296987 [Microstroma glucosiphilum]|uniref:SET domain-containing protein n=1 Tax=Pseudomicrostroma glucosiphilum TaxID=1684307 RepID=A0A316UCU8_9BASI|nr:hypothetical protein BCV69DRAFT_296987 [Pseudomicrostroma glucosiphilum]PWN23026.1 hypothetical protein BCV69DRAFT_296987 [Pseudomicrostroma glucosiphilum]